MDKIEYSILEDGYAALFECMEVNQFFIDNDVIGKKVKCADLYMNEHDSYSFGRFSHSEWDKYKGLNLKTCFFGGCPTFFVVEFTDGTFLSVDYSFDPGVYIKYGNDLTFPGRNPRYIPPVEYRNLFDHLKGEIFEGISMPCECSVSCFDDGQSHGYIELERLFFKFTNFFWKNEDHEVEFTGGENEIHWDYIMTYCEFREMPMIAYYSDRYNIPFFESEREHYFVL